MDKDLAEGARKLYADDIYNLVRECYNKENREYLKKQFEIAKSYMTEEQRKEVGELFSEEEICNV